MPGPVGDARGGDARGGDVEPLFPQEQKASGREESSATTSGPRQPTSGVAGLSCPPVRTLPDVQPAATFFFANAQNQDGVCSAPPPRSDAQTLPAVQNTNAAPSLSAASPAALIANCHDVDDVVKVLKGLTGRDQQHYAVDVVNLALRRFGDVDHINNLVEAVQNNPALRPIVVEQLVHRAAELESKSTPENRDTLDGPHHQACAYVLAALKAMHGEELGALIAQKLSPKEGEWLAKTLDVQNPSGVNGLLSKARHQLLSALNSVPRTDTTSAFVQTLYLLMLPEDTIIYCPPLAASLATALGREFYPQPQLARTAAAEKERLQAFLHRPEGAALMLTGTQERRQRVLGTLQKNPAFNVKTFEHHDGPWVIEPTFARALAGGIVPANAPNREALAQHIGEILATEQGQEIRFGWYGFDKKIDLEIRVEAMQAILDNGITAKDLQQTTNPWENSALVKAIAAKRMALAGINADVPIKFRSREELIKFVAFTSGMKPDHPKVTLIVDQLVAQGGSEPVVSFRPVFFSSRTTGVVQFPLYRTDVLYSFGQNRSGQNQLLPDQTFVDDVGRAYKTEPHKSAFEIWKGTNWLPSGVVVFPKGGRISRDETGALALEVRDTPEKGRGAEKAVTAAMMVGGIYAGGLTLVGEGSWIVSVIGGASSLHGGDSALAELDDRATHGESNAWSNPEGRAAKLSLAASVAGLGLFGVGPALKDTIYADGLTHEMALAVSVVNTVGAVTDAAASVNGAVYLINNYKQMSGDDIGLALLQLGWQGLMSGVGIVQAGGLGHVLNPMVSARALIAQHLAPPRIHYGSNEVAGNAVEIRLVDGHYEIFAGPHADSERIAHHVNVVRQIEGDITFTEMLGRWFGVRSNKEITTTAADIRKLDSWIAQQRLKLESAHLTPGERDAILNDIAVCTRRRDELIDRLVKLRDKPDDDRGGQPILLPDLTGGPSNRVRYIRTPAHDLVDALPSIDRREFDRAIRETGASSINEPERIIDWFVKNQKFAGRSLLDRALGLPDYEQAWQQFLKARVAGDRSDPTLPVRTFSPETRLVMTLGDVNLEAFKRAAKEIGSYSDAARIIDWFVKNEGLGTKSKYEPVWQKYLSSLTKERQGQQQPKAAAAPVPWQQPAPDVAPIPYEPGAPAPGEPDEKTVMQTGHPIFQDLRGQIVVSVSGPQTNSLVNHLFASLGDINSGEARAFIASLKSRIQMQSNDQP